MCLLMIEREIHTCSSLCPPADPVAMTPGQRERWRMEEMKHPSHPRPPPPHSHMHPAHTHQVNGHCMEIVHCNY